MERMRTGTYFLEMLWYFTAEKVVSTAITYYKLDEERASALRRVFLREADYVIRMRKPLE